MDIFCLNSEIEYNKIKIKQPYLSSGNKKIFNIHYGNSCFLLQTPCITLAYKITVYDNNYCTADFLFDDNKSFIMMVESIYDNVCRRISRFEKLPLHVRSNIKENKLRVKNDNIDSIKCFDASLNLISYKTLHQHDRIKALIQIQRVLLNIESHELFFHLNVLQIRKMTPLAEFDKCFLHDDLTKYEKMLSFGIPLDALRHKMQIDNISTDAIERFFNKKRVKAPPPPPPLPPCPIAMPENKNGGLPFLNDILKGQFKLKKHEHKQETKKDDILLQLKNVNNGYSPPSLNDLLQAKNSLRVTKTL